MVLMGPASPIWPTFRLGLNLKFGLDLDYVIKCSKPIPPNQISNVCSLVTCLPKQLIEKRSNPIDEMRKLVLDMIEAGRAPASNL